MDIRYTIETQVFDQDSEKLENISVEVFSGGLQLPMSYLEANKGLIFGSGNDRGDLISFSKTNSTGNAILHFPVRKRGRNSTEVSFYIELVDHEKIKEQVNILVNESDFTDNYILLSEIKLFNKSDLVFVDIKNQTFGYNLLEYFIEGDVSYRILTFESLQNPIKFNLPDNFRVRKNQTLFLTYVLEDRTNGERFEERTPIQVDEENLEFVIQNP